MLTFEIRRPVNETTFVPFGRFTGRHDAEERLAELQAISPRAKFIIVLLAAA